MEKPGIIGCGTMGHAIALTIAWAGLPVTLYGINSSETQMAQSAILDKLKMLSGNGLFDSGTIELIKNRITITHSIDEIAAVSSFIIECIPENIDLKKNLLYKCGWSPLEGTNFKTKVTHTFVNGNLVFENGNFPEFKPGQRLEFHNTNKLQ